MATVCTSSLMHNIKLICNIVHMAGRNARQKLVFPLAICSSWNLILKRALSAANNNDPAGHRGASYCK
jgi:hypothetical protein